jgi:hypothetical protein
LAFFLLRVNVSQTFPCSYLIFSCALVLTGSLSRRVPDKKLN